MPAFGACMAIQYHGEQYNSTPRKKWSDGSQLFIPSISVCQHVGRTTQTTLDPYVLHSSRCSMFAPETAPEPWSSLVQRRCCQFLHIERHFYHYCSLHLNASYSSAMLIASLIIASPSSTRCFTVMQRGGGAMKMAVPANNVYMPSSNGQLLLFPWWLFHRLRQIERLN